MSDILTVPRTRALGPFEVGTLAYGCWRFAGTPLEEARAKVGAALEIGANLLDTAAIYGFGETGFGEAEERLGDLFAADPGLRERVVLVTKGGIVPPEPYDSRAPELIASAEASLKRLKVDAIDVFLVHRPDLLVSHEEVAGALSDLRARGVVREVGVSNFTPAQTRALQSFLDFPMVVTQPEISVGETSALFDGTLDLAQEVGLTPMAWSPLGGGALMTGDGPVAAELDRIGGGDRAAAALAWLMAHPARPIPILGSQTPDRIRAAAAAYDIQMTRRDWYAVLEASLGHPMP